MEKNEELQLAIQEAIQNSLPKTAGDLLQKRLLEADQLESARDSQAKWITELEKKNEEYRKTIVELSSTITKFEAKESHLDAKELSLNKKEVALADKERNLELILVKKELEYSKTSKDELFTLTNSVFRNSTLKKVITSNITGDISTHYNEQGMMETTNSGSKNGFETTEITEE